MRLTCARNSSSESAIFATLHVVQHGTILSGSYPRLLSFRSMPFKAMWPLCLRRFLQVTLAGTPQYAHGAPATKMNCSVVSGKATPRRLALPRYQRIRSAAQATPGFFMRVVIIFRRSTCQQPQDFVPPLRMRYESTVVVAPQSQSQIHWMRPFLRTRVCGLRRPNFFPFRSEILDTLNGSRSAVVAAPQK